MWGLSYSLKKTQTRLLFAAGTSDGAHLSVSACECVHALVYMYKIEGLCVCAYAPNEHQYIASNTESVFSVIYQSWIVCFAGSSVEMFGVACRLYAHTCTQTVCLPVPANSLPQTPTPTVYILFWDCSTAYFSNDSPAIRHKLLFFSTHFDEQKCPVRGGSCSLHPLCNKNLWKVFRTHLVS